MKLARLMWRAALGGLIGGLLYLIGDVFNELLRLGYVPWSGAFQIMAIPYVAVTGLICGSVMGFIIWVLFKISGFELPFLARATIGILFIVFISTVSYLVWGDPYIGLNTPPLINQFFGMTLGVMLFGALPAIAARPAKPFRGTEEVAEFRARNLAKLEVASGLLTFVIAGCLSAVVFRLDWDALPKPETNFRSDQEFLLVTLFFLVPALLVALGSCIHAGSKRPWGQVVLAIGCALVLISSIFFVVFLPFDKIYLWSWLNICFVLLAMMSLVLSIKAGPELKQTRDVASAN